MTQHFNTIRHGDCVAGLAALPAGSVDLAFADPPFNIGYDYDVYRDNLEGQQYVAWSRAWIEAVYRALNPQGAFWLAIGDEYAAELKLESQRIGFRCRSWVVWYYTFGVNCDRKFTRSHAHLFHFVKDPEQFTFREDDLDNRIPSARQLVYNDKRANPLGRLPDDTWLIRPAGAVGELAADELLGEGGSWDPEALPAPADAQQTWTLRPQDLAECFTPTEDTWYFPRVAGTFKERAGFHGCQMPEQLLGRIVRTCSNPGDLVIDPFSGSGTTLAVAKKLGRRFLGFDISPEYVKAGKARLEAIRVGDPLDGSPEPLMSAPKTNERPADHAKRGKKQAAIIPALDPAAVERRYAEVQRELTLRGVVQAFGLTHQGFSADRVVVDPELNQQFAEACKRLGLVGNVRTWNVLLFRLRKSGKLAHVKTTERTDLSWGDCDGYLYASEIALQHLIDAGQARTLDEILCDPALSAEFDRQAAQLRTGFKPVEYRWAALKLRKQAKLARSRGSVLGPPPRLGNKITLAKLNLGNVPARPGVYLLTNRKSQKLYVGEALNLRGRLTRQFDGPQRDLWAEHYGTHEIQTYVTDAEPAEMLAWQSCLVNKYKPTLNFKELCAAT